MRSADHELDCCFILVFNCKLYESNGSSAIEIRFKYQMPQTNNGN